MENAGFEPMIGVYIRGENKEREKMP